MGYNKAMDWICIGLMGVMGVLARYAVDQKVPFSTQSMPWGTLSVNLVGSLAAGLVFGWTERFFAAGAIGSAGQGMVLLRNSLLIGFMGGFTTFSAYCLQSVRMMESGLWQNAFLYLIFSPLAGVLGAFLGLCIGRTLS